MDIPDRLKEVEESVEYLSTQKELLGQISAQLEQLNQHVFGKEKEIGEHSFNNDNGRSPNRGSHGLGRFSSFLPKTLEIDFPRYDGRNDPTTRIGKAEKYFHFMILLTLIKSPWLLFILKISSVIEYQTRFERVLDKVGNLAQDKKISCFVKGLRDTIRTDVQAHCPSTLTVAIGLAKLYEARDQAQKKPNQPIIRSARPTPTSNNLNFPTTTTIK
ncbi:hypothetical protein LWI28_021152 [Acer negundo]|uniref:Uncharacterized protein n=1 Tax=Acer negundo TaxID=4023 RepID=A0AAD5JK49_ACENE|nr:hypothetical protein LWI28_021152 [Acer negundo]